MNDAIYMILFRNQRTCLSQTTIVAASLSEATTFGLRMMHGIRGCTHVMVFEKDLEGGLTYAESIS